jgi:ABC-type amino acid transport substrate-binding protein
VKELNPGIVLSEPPVTEPCIEDLLEGRVEAITAADWLYYPAVVAHEELSVVGDDLTTEGYGAVVEPGASAWVDLVNNVFSEAGAEGDWQRFYDATFDGLIPGEVVYPDMTGEEAAALYPADI